MSLLDNSFLFHVALSFEINRDSLRKNGQPESVNEPEGHSYFNVRPVSVFDPIDRLIREVILLAVESKL